jgi:hypothetical protein
LAVPSSAEPRTVFGSLGFPPLDRLVISSIIPGATANATYSKELKIEAPNNSLIRLGAAAGAIAALMLLVAMYATALE